MRLVPLLWPLAACLAPTRASAGPSVFEDVLEACEAESQPELSVTWNALPGSTTDWAGVPVMPVQLSVGCVEASAEVIGLDWESLESVPSAITSPSSVAELLVLAIAQLALADYGTIGRMRQSVITGEMMDRALKSEPFRRWPDDTPANALLIDYVSEAVRLTRSLPGNDCIMSYDRGIVNVCFDQSVFDFYYSSAIFVLPTALAASFVHEACHRDGPGHIGPQQLYDQDDKGCYGMGARVEELWLDVNVGRATDLDWSAAYEYFEGTCTHILEDEEGGPCSRLWE